MKTLTFLILGALTLGKSLSAQVAPSIEEVQYGTSLGGERLVAYKLLDPSVKDAQRFGVMITGGVHGNEYMGLVAKFPQIFSELSSVRSFVAAGGVVYFIPMINPDGVKTRGRMNSEGLDLNRTFMSEYYSLKRESAQLSDWFARESSESGVKLVLSMDYHCCKGSLIYPEISAETWEAKKSFYQEVFKSTAMLMKEELDQSYNSGITKSIFGYETRGTLKDYWFHKYGTVSFTFEGSSPRGELSKLDGHVRWWDKIFGELTALPAQSVAMISPEWTNLETTGLTPGQAQSE